MAFTHPQPVVLRARGRLARVLVLQVRHLGDVLLTTPLFRALRTNLPGAELIACVTEGAEPMLEANPDVDGVVSVPRRRAGDTWLAHWGREFGVLRSIGDARFDLVLDLTANDRTALLARLSGAPVRIAYRRRGFFGKNRLYSATRPLRAEMHIVRQHLGLLALAGLEVPAPWPGLVFRYQAADHERVCSLLGSHARFVQMHPVSRIARKCWPDAFTAQLADHLAARGLHPVFTGSDQPEERARMANILRQVRAPYTDLGGRLSLKELGALSSRATLFVGVDTGPMHIAAAVGTPVVALFGPSSERLWEPWCARRLVLSQDLACRMPCQRKSACTTIECLNELTPAMAIPQVDEFLVRLRL